MDLEVKNITDNTDFVGYVIVDWDGLFGTTTCPNNAAAMCLERSRTGGPGLAEYVKAYSVGSMGQYHHTPGERFCWDYDWNRAVNELMN
jgi:hypothetical protein